MADPEILKGSAAEGNASALLSVIANVYNEHFRVLYVKRTLTKILSPVGDGRTPPPLNPPTCLSGRPNNNNNSNNNAGSWSPYLPIAFWWNLIFQTHLIPFTDGICFLQCTTEFQNCIPTATLPTVRHYACSLDDISSYQDRALNKGILLVLAF